MGDDNKRPTKRVNLKKEQLIDKDGKLTELGTCLFTIALIKAMNLAFKVITDLVEDDNEETNLVN